MVAAAAAPQNKASLGTAKAVPILLAFIVAYTSYVLVGPLCVGYLLNPPEGQPQRLAAGIAIPIVWVFLLIPSITTYLRILLLVFKDPGYTTPAEAAKDTERPAVPDDIWMRDAFVCDPQGHPLFCFYCRTYKPDRAHHNQDVGRCTLKMDHFCPWVGGVVGEKTMKFFIQFLIYASLLSTYLLTVMAYFVHEDRSHVQWLVSLGLAGFFTLFTIGMVVNSLWMIFRNVTTIENIDHASRTMLMAVLLPPEMRTGLGPAPPLARISRSRSDGGTSSTERPLTSDLDDPSHLNYFNNERIGRPPRPSQSKHWKGTITYPLTLPTDRPPIPAPSPRTFAILETWPGCNPWDLGSPWLNFKAVFGEVLHQWVLPIGFSPCCNHAPMVSFYPLGPDFEELLEEAGLVQRSQEDMVHGGPKAGRDKKKRRVRRLSAGWQNGERPPGWQSEKEARRARKEAQWRLRDGLQ